MTRKDDHERVANTLALHPDDARIPPVVDLLEDVRAEAVAACRNAMHLACVRLDNSHMTSERLQRLLDAPSPDEGGPIPLCHQADIAQAAHAFVVEQSTRMQLGDQRDVVAALESLLEGCYREWRHVPQKQNAPASPEQGEGSNG